MALYPRRYKPSMLSESKTFVKFLFNFASVFLRFIRCLLYNISFVVRHVEDDLRELKAKMWRQTANTVDQACPTSDRL
jgi:hypothetical protein